MSSKKPLQEGDVQSYAEGQSIKQIHPNAEIHLDHIPSKQAIKLAYAEAIDKIDDLDDSTIRDINKKTTTLATYVENHRDSSTSKINSKLALIDKDVLALASVRDLSQYKNYELQRGVLSEAQIDTAIEKVHNRNYDLGLYTPDEVNIAQKYTKQLEELDLNKKAHIPSFDDVAKEYHANFNETPKLNTDIFENRLAKPSIIVGATLASMVFTEKSEASTIPTLHLNAHLSKDKFDSLSQGEQIGAQIGAGFNTINAIQATEEFKSGASKSASTLLDSNAYKEGFKEISQDAMKPILTKDVASMGVKESAKFAGKSLLKKLPIVGLVAGVGFGIGRAMDGDWEGAAMEIASGAASIIPGPGTTASVGIDLALLERDTGILSKGTNKLLGREGIEEERLVPSEDNHTTIPIKQDINFSNDLDQEALEQRVDPQTHQTLNLNQVQDRQSETIAKIDTTQKSKEVLADLYPHLIQHLGMTNSQKGIETQKEEPNHTQDNYSSRDTNISSNTFENNSYYVEDDFNSMPKNHRPTNLPNNVSQQPLEENSFDSSAKANEIVAKMVEENGWDNDYGNSDDMGRDID